MLKILVHTFIKTNIFKKHQIQIQYVKIKYTLQFDSASSQIIVNLSIYQLM